MTLVFTLPQPSISHSLQEGRRNNMTTIRKVIIVQVKGSKMEPRRRAGEHSTVTNKERANYHQLCRVHRGGEDFVRILVSLTKGGMSGTELFSFFFRFFKDLFI